MAVQPAKPGVKTSELYVLIAGTLASVLIGMGLMTQADADALKTGAAALGDLIVAAAPVVSGIVYTVARTLAKTKGGPK